MMELDANGIKSVKVYATNDLAFAAYLIAIHNFKLNSAKRFGSSYRFELYSDNGKRNVEILKLKYIGSESARFDNAVRDLKRMLFSDRGD